MMASPPSLDEEERRLLREYRLTTFPTRRDVRSTTASPTTTPTPTTTTTTTTTTNRQPFSPALVNNNSDISPNNTSNHQNSKDSKATKINPNGGGGPHNHRHHHHHHHHPHHHHKDSNHRRHKSVTPTHELTADELNQMLELATNLGIIKLVPEQKKTDADEHKQQPEQNPKPYYIFEKVNYIRRMNQRKKARRKARNGGT